MIRIIALLLTILLLPSVSNADGNSFLIDCNGYLNLIDDKPTNVEAYTMGACFGQVVGVMQAGRLINRLAEKGGYTKQNIYCTPDGVDIDQAIRVVVKFLKKNPEILHYKNTDLIAIALGAAYPCK